MSKITIILFSLIIILIGFILLLTINNQSIITGEVTKESEKLPNELNKHSFTKAICDDKNFCQDYEIKCEGDTVRSISPITGAAVQFDESWTDPRTQEQIDKLCE